MTMTKIAAIQAAPIFLDLEATVDKTIGLIEEAASNGVQLLVFPETWLPGYPWWIWLGSPAWGMQFLGRYFENSIEAGSPQDVRIAEAAGKHNMHIVMGVSERKGGSLYIGQWHYGPNGQVLSRRRKLKPTHAERTVFGEGDGSDMIVLDTEIGNIGALCCWEHLQPLSKFAMYSQNEQIHCAAWPGFSVYRGAAYALGPELNTAASQMYAAEGQCFVIASCGMVSKEMIEMMCDSPDKQQLLLEGGGFSAIFGPDGSPLAEQFPETQEGLLIAEIDLGMIAFAKAVGDPVGHYSRPDVFRLMINRNPGEVVMDFDSGHDLVTDGVYDSSNSSAS